MDAENLDRAHHLMMRSFIESGRALHYTALAAAMGLAPEEGKTLLHDLMDSGIPAWLYPDTDQVASFSPFNNQPTQYRITIEGVQKWYGQ